MLHKVNKSPLTDVTYIGARAGDVDIDYFSFSEEGLEADIAGQIVNEILDYDTNPRLNLATYCCTHLPDPVADQLALRGLKINAVDVPEYPSMKVFGHLITNYVANLCNVPEGGNACGVQTIGSSEAIMLGVLSAKKRWQSHRKALGLPIDNPVLLVSEACHVCFIKAAMMFDLELKLLPCESVDNLIPSVETVRQNLDDRVVCLGAVLGNTYTNAFDPIAEYNDLLEEYNATHDWKIMMHVDAASGGFFAPFICPELVWDFRLKNVASINISIHKFGNVPTGIGQVVWRSHDLLHSDLVYHVGYLGEDEETFSINFSKSGCQIVLAAFTFLRLGRKGYRDIAHACNNVAEYFRARLVETGLFSITKTEGFATPVVTFRIAEGVDLDASELCDRLKKSCIPAYPLPGKHSDVTMMRVVIREGITKPLIDLVTEEILTTAKKIMKK